MSLEPYQPTPLEQQSIEWSNAVLDWSTALCDEVPALRLLCEVTGGLEGGPDMILPFDNGHHSGLLIWFVDKVANETQSHVIQTYIESMQGKAKQYSLMVVFGSVFYAMQAIKEYLAAASIYINTH